MYKYGMYLYLHRISKVLKHIWNIHGFLVFSRIFSSISSLISLHRGLPVAHAACDAQCPVGHGNAAAAVVHPGRPGHRRRCNVAPLRLLRRATAPGADGPGGTGEIPGEVARGHATSTGRPERWEFWKRRVDRVEMCVEIWPPIRY